MHLVELRQDVEDALGSAREFLVTAADALVRARNAGIDLAEFVGYLEGVDKAQEAIEKIGRTDDTAPSDRRAWVLLDRQAGHTGAAGDGVDVAREMDARAGARREAEAMSDRAQHAPQHAPGDNGAPARPTGASVQPSSNDFYRSPRMIAQRWEVASQGLR